MSVARPCVITTCTSDGGQPSITSQVMCGPCRRMFWRDLKCLVRDYAMIKDGLMVPRRPGDMPTTAGPARRESFGHPAEWASDTCRDIADALDNIAQSHADAVGVRWSPVAAGGATESALVRRAYNYLWGSWERVCVWPDVGPHAEAVMDTHRTIRSTLGQARYVKRVDVPCPKCGLLSLAEETGVVWCRSAMCGYQAPREHFALCTRVLLWDLMADI